MGKVDLVLVNPSDRAEVYQALGVSLTAIEPPIWAGLMATFARGKGLTVAIIDADAESLTPAMVAERVEALAPKLTAVVVYGHQPSASTQNMSAAGKACKALKQLRPDAPLLLLGGHVSALPERTLREECADYVGEGEGLHTLVELCQGVPVEQVRGLCWLDADGAFRRNASAPLVRDLDHEMPGVAWDLLPMDRYRAHNWHCFGGLDRQPYASIYTTLGCPFHCAFCCIQAPFKSGEAVEGMNPAINSYRYWSPEKVLAQIDTLVLQYGVKNIKFADEMFVLNPKHIGAICDGLIERNYGLNIWAYTRVDTVKPAYLDKLKRAGIRWLAVGIETASEHVRGDVQKGFGQVEIAHTIKAIQDAGIHVIGNYIFGLPEDDLASMQATLDLALELNCEMGNFYCAMAYPGSQLYREAEREGLPLPATWSGYSQHAYHTLPLPTRHLPASEVLRFRDAAFKTYCSSPRYLAMVAEKFGQETADQILAATKIDLPRALLEAPQPVTAGEA